MVKKINYGGIIMADKWRMKGYYIKNCNCIASCPCDTMGVPYPHKGCEGMAGMHIIEGHYGNVKLDGLMWVIVVTWPGAVHEGNGRAQPFISKSATEEQRGALLQILSGQAGNKWFEVVSTTLTEVLEPQFTQITFEFDKNKRKAKVSIPGFLETTTGPLTIPATGDEQRVIVKMPNGMEYKEMEVASAQVLRASGPIKFNHRNTHSSLAIVEQTSEGLKG